jgi:TonB dependent receptor
MPPGSRRSLLAVFALLLCALPLAAQQASLLLTITDENGVAVVGATADLVWHGSPTPVRCQSDHAGRCRFTAPPGAYRLIINKDGFYALTLNDVKLGEMSHLDARLAHVQEVKENVEVTASTPGIDPAQVASTETLGSREIVNVPYPTTRDVRNALPYIPGVLQDSTGQVHIAGADTWQTMDVLDGFNITHPVTGTLDLRFSTDAVRSIDVQNSRYSAEYGPASGGVLDFGTTMGDDRLRFSATNFIPSVQTKKGIGLDKWTPRVTLSGPIVKGRAWFLIAPDGEYDTNLIKELPEGADRAPVWRVSNLAKLQVNITQSNIFTGSFLVNHLHSDFGGLSVLNPKETTLRETHSAYLATLKDQHYFHNGMLLELGFAAIEFHDHAAPLGSLPFVITPEAVRGNNFKTSAGRALRLQGIANVYLPPQHLAGRHDLKFGLGLERLDDHQAVTRRPIDILRENGTLFTEIAFTGPAAFDKSNAQFGVYLQDRWSPRDRLLIESGLRFDRDRIVSHTNFSPRVAATYVLTRDRETKLTAGIGLFHDPTNLDFITRPLAGERLQTFFAADGVTPTGAPLPTTFTVNERALQSPRYINWSVGIERRLPASIFARAEFLERRGARGFVFENTAGSTLFTGAFQLQNTRDDRHDALQISARRVFHGEYEILAAYTRSRTRSSAVLDFTLDNPIFSAQAAGPLPWDAPNQFVSWGFLPAPHFKKWDVGYSAIWRSGFPFSVVNQNQQLVGAPGSHRFPDYLTLNLFLERRFTLRNYNLALRFGFDDLTDHRNPLVVNNNIDSPQFLTFSEFQDRAFTARIRFLGRKK